MSGFIMQKATQILFINYSKRYRLHKPIFDTDNIPYP